MKQFNQLVCGNPNIFRSIQRFSEKAVNRLMACSVVQKCLMFIFALTVSVGEAMAGSKGAAGFTKATQEVSSYQTPVSNLMKAIAAMNHRFGLRKIHLAVEGEDKQAWHAKSEFRSGNYLSDLKEILTIQI